MNPLDQLALSGKFSVWKSMVGLNSIYYAKLTKCGYKNPFIGCGKSTSKKNGIRSAIAECIERNVFQSYKPDKDNMRSNELDVDHIDDLSHQYFCNYQLDSPSFPYKRWVPNDRQSWTIMEDTRGNSIAFPFEGFNSKRKYYRPSSSGWAVHITKKNAFRNALSECAERHMLMLLWLTNENDLYEITELPNEHRFKDLGIEYKAYIFERDGFYLSLICVQTNNTILNIKHTYFSSDGDLNPSIAIRNALNGILQKHSWITQSQNKDICFVNNASAFHRENYSRNGDTILTNKLLNAKQIKYAKLSNAPAFTYSEYLANIDRDKSRVYYKSFDLYSIYGVRLYAVKAFVLGYIPGTFGSDYYQPLYNLYQGMAAKELLLSKKRYHPFA